MSGLFGSRPQTSTSTRETDTTSTTRGKRTKRQSNLFKEIIDQLAETINEGAGIRPEDLTDIRGQVKGTYGQIAPRLGNALRGRGLSTTGGKVSSSGSNLRGVDIARGNQMAASRSGLADLAQKRYAQTLGMALPFTRPTTTTSTSSGTETGSQTRPGPSLFDQILGYAAQGLGIATSLGAFSPAAVGGPPMSPQITGNAGLSLDPNGFGAAYGTVPWTYPDVPPPPI